VATFAEFLRRQATTAVLERIIVTAFSEVAVDAAALRDPAVRQFLTRDIQALCARSIRGFASEHSVYANGWEPPAGLPPDKAWTLAASSELPAAVDWLPLSQVRRVSIPGAGILPQFTHPQALADLFA
jgi:hypothetical protein